MHYAFLYRLRDPKAFAGTALGILLAILGTPSIPSGAQSNDICEGLSMGKEVQIELEAYQVAICLRGMGPTHMVVINKSKISTGYSVKTLLLAPVSNNKCHECSPNVGSRSNVYVFYKAVDMGIVYTVDIRKDASALFTITSNGKVIYTDWTSDVSYGDLIRP